MAQADKQRSSASKKDRSAKQQTAKQAIRKPHPLEWATGGVSAAIVLALICFILYQAISAGAPHPDLEIEVERIVEDRQRYHVQFRAYNRGNATAAAVVVEGELKEGDETLETSQVTLDYVPAQSQQAGGLFFDNDPSRYDLQIEAKGYQTP